MTFNLAQRSFKVIHFGGNSTRLGRYNFRPIFNRFEDIAGFIFPELYK